MTNTADEQPEPVGAPLPYDGSGKPQDTEEEQ